jgi:GT2 family glycosyltransferase
VSGQVKSVIVGTINFHSEERIAECFRSILAKSPAYGIEFVVVDNSDTLGVTSVAGEPVKVIRGGGNLGYAGGVNLLIEYARTMGVVGLWVVNPDLVGSAGCLEALVVASSRYPEFDILTPIVLSGSTGKIWFGGGEFDRSTGRTEHSGYGQVFTPENEPLPPVATSWVSGCSMFLAPAFLERCPELDMKFFLYLEELEWQLRSGAHVGVISECPVYHEEGTSSRDVERSIQTYFMARNRILLMRRLHRWSLRWILTWAKEFVVVPVAKGKVSAAGWGMLGALTTAQTGQGALKSYDLVHGWVRRRRRSS